MSYRDLMTDDVLDSNIIMVGIPYDKSTSIKSGAKDAPMKLLKLSEYLPPYTMNMEDIKPLKIYDEGMFYLKKNVKSFEVLAESIYYIYKMEKFNFFIGGDHSIAISTEKAFIRNSIDNKKIPVVFHFDAHADICDFYDNSYLSHANPNKRTIDNGLDTSNLVMFGIRSYEDQEVEYLSNHKEIKIFNPESINNNIDEVFKYLEKYKSEKYDIHLSFDIDFFDPAYAPGTGTPEHFGVLSTKGLELIKHIVKNYNVKSMDLVEISPKLDVNDVTSWLGLKMIYEILYILKGKLL